MYNIHHERKRECVCALKRRKILCNIISTIYRSICIILLWINFPTIWPRKSILIPTHFSVSKHSNNASLQFLTLVHAKIFKQIATDIHIYSRRVLRIPRSVKLKYGPRKIKRRCVVYKFTMNSFFIFCCASFLGPSSHCLQSLLLYLSKPSKCKTQN